MRKKILIFSVIAAVGFVAGAAKAFTPIDLKVTPNINKVDPAVTKAWHDSRCAKFKEKMETKISNIEQKQTVHKNTLDNLVSRFETLINRLDDKGYDTAQLKTDLNTLKDKIAKFEEDLGKAVDEANATKDNVCSDDDAKIKVNLGETRTLVQQIRSDVKDIRTFYQTEIRNDIKAIKNQTPKEL